MPSTHIEPDLLDLLNTHIVVSSLVNANQILFDWSILCFLSTTSERIAWFYCFVLNTLPSTSSPLQAISAARKRGKSPSYFLSATCCNKIITGKITLHLVPKIPLWLSHRLSSPPSSHVSPLSDFHPRSWENRSESSWQQRWGERGGFSDEGKKGFCGFERAHCVLLPHCFCSISVI